MTQFSITDTMNSRWNDARRCSHIPAAGKPDSGSMLNLAFVPCEKAVTADTPLWPEERINAAIDGGTVDSLCVEIVCRVAAGKYLTAGMLCDFLALQGLRVTRKDVQIRLELLESCGFVRSIFFSLRERRTLHCYSLGENGNLLVKDAGLANFHLLRYLNDRERRQRLCPWEAPAHSIKGVLQANRLILSLLQSGASIRSFGLMPTLSDSDFTNTGAIVRTTAGLIRSDGREALVEVVRRNANAEVNLPDKVARFSRLCSRMSSGEAQPRLILCCEDPRHTRQVKALLARKGLLSPQLLFTCDSGTAEHPGIFRRYSDAPVCWISCTANRQEGAAA